MTSAIYRRKSTFRRGHTQIPSAVDLVSCKYQPELAIASSSRSNDERPKDRARQETSRSDSNETHSCKEQQKSKVRDYPYSHHIGDILVYLTVNAFDQLNICSLLTAHCLLLTDQGYPFPPAFVQG